MLWRLVSRVSWLGFYCFLLGAAGFAADTPKRQSADESWLIEVAHQPKQPRSGEPVKITAEVQNVTAVTLRYQIVEPGAYLERKDAEYATRWVSVPMTHAKKSKRGESFVAELPSNLQKNRRLVRYRLAAEDADAHPRTAPDPRGEGNFAYFVYDGIPAWKAAINPKSDDPLLRSPLNFPVETMRQVQAYHLLGKKTSIENATWKEEAPGKEYKYTGTLVVDGEVFDHIGYRARGGVWRYAMVKNMWKFDLGKDHRLVTRDDFGQTRPVSWNKVDLRGCIQQGDYGYRGEQGMFESVGFRLFNLAGVAAPFTQWIQLRVIDEAEENPVDQYGGDFWGLYLAIENEDGRFLKSHELPDGNLYKMEGGGGELKHHGGGMVTNRSDLEQFVAGYATPNPNQSWWRANLNLPAYYSYRAICECIHHYDIGDGKNYDFFHDPKTGQWQVAPWDIDLTWADSMYGTGDEPFKQLVLSQPTFRLEYQNRLRELRDLLFNPEQAGQLIDDYARVIGGANGQPAIAEADRRKWDFHPMMTRSDKAGQGLFYRAAPTKDFAGMVARMKDYVRARGAWIDENLLSDAGVPSAPVVAFGGIAGFPADGLRFRAMLSSGTNALSSIKWRLGEVSSGPASGAARRYEITALWESGELKPTGEEVAVPSGVVQAGHTYRARARVRDTTGRWGHWSAPVEFVAGK